MLGDRIPTGKHTTCDHSLERSFMSTIPMLRVAPRRNQGTIYDADDGGKEKGADGVWRERRVEGERRRGDGRWVWRSDWQVRRQLG